MMELMVGTESSVMEPAFGGIHVKIKKLSNDKRVSKPLLPQGRINTNGITILKSQYLLGIIHFSTYARENCNRIENLKFSQYTVL